jgi:hypothetical protein
MTWRVAASLLQLRNQINAMHPKRKKLSDGTIGDRAHASRSSDHNPWVRDAGVGVVTALDITHDPANGVNCHELAERLKDDPRVKYVIWNRRIYNAALAQVWRAYRGKNPHTVHIHVSVHPIKRLYDSVRIWDLVQGPDIGEEPVKSDPSKKGNHL